MFTENCNDSCSLIKTSDIDKCHSSLIYFKMVKWLLDRTCRKLLETDCGLYWLASYYISINTVVEDIYCAWCVLFSSRDETAIKTVD